MTAHALLKKGHDVVVHARSTHRAAALDTLRALGAQLVVGDLSKQSEVHAMAATCEHQAPFDAIIHNAGVYRGPEVIPVNVVAPYMLTALIPVPARIVFISSQSHFGGRHSVENVDWSGVRPGSYDDSKMYVTTLAMAVARLYPTSYSHAVDPGWVPT
ncbi:MAG TPA: SDR family NAD(P)-dependent oxidoreductase, partial [Naasia sp.]